jgi:hypothetical protein
MKHLRRTAAAATAALAISGAAVLTGLGAAPAQATDYSLSEGRVVVQLTPSETELVAFGFFFAASWCSVEVLPMAEGYVDIPMSDCSAALHECSIKAGPSPASAYIFFYPGRSTCLVMPGSPT